LTRGVNAVEDVLYGCGGERGAGEPSTKKAVIYWCTSPRVKEVGGEGSEVGAATPGLLESCSP